MIVPWETARIIHDNARGFTFCHEKPIDYDPVKAFLTTSLSILNALYESGIVDLTAETRVSLWRLRNTVLYSLLPFDHPSLELDRLLDNAVRRLKVIPSLEPQQESLSGSIKFLLDNPYNPKRERVEQILGQWALEVPKGMIGIVAPPARTSPLGWGVELIQSIPTTCRHISILRSAGDLQTQVWSKVLIPFGGTECRFLRNLLESYRTPAVHLLAYAHERRAKLTKTTLPRPESGSERDDAPMFLADNESRNSEEEERLEREFWEIRRRVAMQESGHDDSEYADTYLVPARLVLLAGDTMVYLATGKKELIGNATVTGEDEDSFCYRPVTGIRDGDYLVLRTGTNTDLIRSISESMMRKDGKLELCDGAFDWKPMLKRALSTLGTDEFVSRLARLNVDVSPAQYVWAWTADLVMRPGTSARFQAVLQVISEAGAYTSTMAISDFARDRWQRMQTIENYHRRAGFRIRKALLGKLADLLAQGGEFADEHRVRLDDEFPGAEIALLRVLDVDHKDCDVPAGRLGRLFHLEGDPWRG